MPLNITKDFIPIGLPTRPQTALKASFITIHNTDNATPGAGAAAHNKYVRGPDAVRRKVSWHFSVDDKAIYQHLPMNEVGWHANRGGNSKSIGIEICMNADMNVNIGYQNAAALVAYCIRELGLNFPSCMAQHHDWSGKNCPSAIRSSSSMSWSAFLDLCDAEVARSDKHDAGTPDFGLTTESAVPEWRPSDANAILKSIDESMGLHQRDEE